MEKRVLKGEIISYNANEKSGRVLIPPQNKLFFSLNSVQKEHQEYIKKWAGVGVKVNIDHKKKWKVSKIWLINVPKNPYYLPKDSAEFLLKKDDIDNNYLKTHKLVHFEKTNKNDPYEKPIWEKLEGTKNLNKLIQEVNKKREALINSLKDSGYTVLSKNLEIHDKLAIGLGHSSVYETAITLDYISGIPYIPASSLKGLLKSFVIGKVLIQDLGNEDDKGKLIILDSYPQEKINIVLDVMNPHYGKYYASQGKTPPADYLEPVPVKFPTIKDSEFKFTFASKKLDEKQLKDLMQSLEEALIYEGIGAKTAVGYGYFKPAKNQTVSQESLQKLINVHNRKN